MKNWCARHNRGALWLWTLAGVIATLAVKIFTPAWTGGVPLVVFMLAAALWMLAGTLLLRWLTVSLSKRPVRLLNDQCDPEPLLRWGDEQMAYWQERRGNYRYYAACLINRGTALAALGRFDELYGMLLAVDEVEMSRQTAPLRVSCEISRCACFLGLERLGEAAAALRAAENLAARIKPLPELEDSLRLSRCALNLMRKRTEGQEEELTALLERAGCEYRRVGVHMLFALLCRIQGREGAERDHLRYVMDHGNKLYIRRRAEELLYADHK